MLFQLSLMSDLTNFVNRITTIIPNKILASLTILIAGFILAKILAIVTRRYLLKIALRTKTVLDDIILSKVEKPLFYVFLVIVLEISLMPLNLKHIYVGKTLTSIVIALVTYIIVTTLDVIIDLWGSDFAKKTNSNIDTAVLPLIHRFSKVFLFLLGFIFILDVWEVQIAPIVASLGIAGIAVAFALQNTLGNVFGGMSIILDKSVKVGDRLRLDDGTMGTIIDVGLRSTKMKTFDNEVIILPNGKLADSRIENLALPDPSARVVVDFGVEYGSDPEKVKKTVLGIIKKLDTLKDSERTPQVWFMDMGDFALKFRAVFWVTSYTEQFMAKVNATEQIHKALGKAKIGIPFPTSTVYLKKRK